jgi:hypothetical protein
LTRRYCADGADVASGESGWSDAVSAGLGRTGGVAAACIDAKRTELSPSERDSSRRGGNGTSEGIGWSGM